MNESAHTPVSPNLQQRLQVRMPPTSRPFMYQTWSELLFLHWIVESETIQATLPKGLTVDCFDGNAYIGVVPFFMRNIRLRGMPALPWVSNFLELNLRTYVHDKNGTPGVWFYSLDCNQPLAVWGARILFHLPYQHASMQATMHEPNGWDYRSIRSRTIADRKSHFQYEYVGDVFYAQPGSLEFFLAERYLLFATNRKGELKVGQVHHTPYPLQHMTVKCAETDLFEWNGFEVPTQGPIHAIGSRGVDVAVYTLHDPESFDV